ncbi:hypothetical protein [Desulfosporosinus lacus]|uniref:Nif11-like leader peptide domain-containing protein n=1 Tax=Desulfosporosinus lacus DSM 15449 TaxID=1121420 RepID=A0A1M5QXD3_9FIRM|nr:hypothetical protein [Desulfosporosinus lacus]SHH18772.1 hypothetical protein SAMN02746098_00396 [Desulfosporosinus lacus DSM 15449]
MDIKDLIESLGEQKEEFFRKGAQCTSAEELLALAVEYSVTLDREGAVKILELMHLPKGKLSDEELESVGGGVNYDNERAKCIFCGRDTLSGRIICKWCDAASGLNARPC